MKAPVLPVTDGAWAAKMGLIWLMNLFGGLSKLSDQQAQLNFTYLCNHILALNDCQYSFLLNLWWILETITIYSHQNFLLESHVIEFINFQIPVCFKKFFSFLLTYPKRVKTTPVKYHLPSLGLLSPSPFQSWDSFLPSPNDFLLLHSKYYLKPNQPPQDQPFTNADSLLVRKI